MIATSGPAFGQVDNVSRAYSREGVIYLQNQEVQARFTRNSRGLEQKFYARKEGQWILTVQGFVPDNPFPVEGNKLFNTKLGSRRILVNENLRDIKIISNEPDRSVVELTGHVEGVQLFQKVSLSASDNYFHFEVSGVLPEEPAKLEYLLSTFEYNRDSVPEFVYTPTLKYDEIRWQTPAEDQILGDRSFHSPAVILQNEGQFAALVPDLKTINERRIVSPDARRIIMIPRNQFSVAIIDSLYTMPTGLDLNVKSGLMPKPVFSFGLIDNIIQHHIRYLHPNDGTMLRTLESNTPQYGFDLFLDANMEKNAGFQQITSFLWEKYGHRVFTDERHLAMPFKDYVNTVKEVTFSPMSVHPPVTGFRDTGSFLEFELEGQKVGGYRSAVPGWLDAIWNCMFWNNVRDAAGMYFWGKQLGDSFLLDKARRTINLTLLAPQNEHGLFPIIYRASTGTWQTNSFDVFNEKFGLFSANPESSSYDVVSMSLTAAYLLRYYRDCEQHTGILPYVKKYGDWLAETIEAEGVPPSYVNVQMQSSEVLRYSAHPAASMWFLAELFTATDDKKYLRGAENIAGYLMREIVPRQKWIDMEQYFSCGAKPLTFTGDKEQGQLARGNLSMGWAAKGFAALYNASQDKSYLEAGEKCIDFLTFSQCSWNPHYIYTAYPFGGFSVDNSDRATFLDARQAEYVDPLIWYGKTLGRQDLLERGVAAARSSTVLINHPLHKANKIYEYTNIYPFGLGPENIDHEGHPQSAMRTHPGWGEGSGVFTGLSDAYRELGGAYIDIERQIAVGVDGVNVEEYVYEDKKLFVTLKSRLTNLEAPYKSPFPVTLKVKGLPSRSVSELIINQKPLGRFTGEDLEELVLQVTPNGNVVLKQ